jgi:NAD-dependent SIR2 family protein deacetylase
MSVELGPLLAALQGRRIAVLTGAGISTESGIPDYRGPETRRRARNPIQGRAFREDAQTRRRYWARSFVGWPRMRAARPNAGHRALVRLQQGGGVTGLITQNVDGLHEAAGAVAVEALHGRLSEVVCLGCGSLGLRSDMQGRLAALNPGFLDPTGAPLAPDGDADLVEAATAGFRVPTCVRCQGVLKPHVVFFGEGVPRDRVDRAFAAVDAADALLIVGSSLAVFSGFRFARHASRTGKPVAIVNLGETRADPLAAARLEVRAGVALPPLVEALLSG